MPAGGGDFQSPLYVLLAFDLIKVLRVMSFPPKDLLEVYKGKGKGLMAVEKIDYLG
jgi:hypothetical protein